MSRADFWSGWWVPALWGFVSILLLKWHDRVEGFVSYDLYVFSQRQLSAGELRELVEAAGLGVADMAASADALTVTRGARAGYCFTLGMPVAVEPEDVPETVTEVVLAPSYLYELMVEGSSSVEIPPAVRFARRLAMASTGVVLDQQTDQIWVQGKLRTCSPMDRGRVDIVELRWYTQAAAADSPRQAATAWLDLARRFLPEAMPRRFGPVEPLAMKLDVDGPDAFVSVVAAEHMSVSFKASAPCIEGHLAGGTDTGAIHAHGLSVHREPLNDHRWRDALKRLFIEFAVRTGAFFASAEVQRGLHWSGRSVWYDGREERTTYLAPRGQWAGLLPYPAWWTWYGPDYVPLVIAHLPADHVHSVGAGLLHVASAQPADRDQLDVVWLPANLTPTADNSDPRVYNPPLTAAAVMPTGLRADTGQPSVADVETPRFSPR